MRYFTLTTHQGRNKIFDVDTVDIFIFIVNNNFEFKKIILLKGISFKKYIYFKE
jgi:hypothetical protein